MELGESGRWGWRIPAGRWVPRSLAAGAAVLAVASLAGAVAAPGALASASASTSRAVLRHRCCGGVRARRAVMPRWRVSCVQYGA